MNLFKKKPVGIILPVDSDEIYKNCKKYGYVNLFITSDKKQVIAYAPNFVGGGGRMCDIPNSFSKRIIKNKTKRADIVEVSRDKCIIKII